MLSFYAQRLEEMHDQTENAIEKTAYAQCVLILTKARLSKKVQDAVIAQAKTKGLSDKALKRIMKDVAAA